MIDIFSEQPSHLFGEQVQALLGKREKEINGKNTVTRTKRGFRHRSVGKESSCNSGICLQCKRPRFDSWVWKISWSRKWQPTPVFLPGESHGQRSPEGYRPPGLQEWDTSVQFSSVTKLCMTLCDPMDRSTPGLPVHHQLPESTHTHVL